MTLSEDCEEEYPESEEERIQMLEDIQIEMEELTIGNICKNYGIDVDKLIGELNKLLK